MKTASPKTADCPDRLMTIKEVAARDNTSEKSVRRAIEAGLLEAIRLGPSGRILRISPEAHAAYRRRRRP